MLWVVGSWWVAGHLYCGVIGCVSVSIGCDIGVLGGFV